MRVRMNKKLTMRVPEGRVIFEYNAGQTFNIDKELGGKFLDGPDYFAVEVDQSDNVIRDQRKLDEIATIAKKKRAEHKEKSKGGLD